MIITLLTIAFVICICGMCFCLGALSQLNFTDDSIKLASEMSDSNKELVAITREMLDGWRETLNLVE